MWSRRRGNEWPLSWRRDSHHMLRVVAWARIAVGRGANRHIASLSVCVRACSRRSVARAVNRWPWGPIWGSACWRGLDCGYRTLAGRFGHWRLLLVPAVAVFLALDVPAVVSLHQQPEESELKAYLRTIPRDPAIVVPILKNPETKSRYMTWSAESSVRRF